MLGQFRLAHGMLTFCILAGAPQLHAEETTGSWAKLFNGNDLTGWTKFLPAESNVSPDQIWSIKEGVIVCQGDTNGYIATEKDYDNYDLRLQWRWGSKVTKSRNSGVLLHVSGADKLWPKSAEAQLQSGSAGDFWLIDKFNLEVDPARKDPKTPIHYYRLKNDNVEKPIGEWNQYDIQCTSETIRLKINGVLVNEGQRPEVTRGRICLQSEGAEIHFKDVELKPLK